MSEPPVLTRAEVRELDRVCIEELGLPGVVLMENAGRGATEVILAELAPVRRALCLCGAGNNGGDGFVVARHLAEAGVEVLLVESAPPDRLSPDAAVFREVAARLGLPSLSVRGGEELRRLGGGSETFDLLVDGLLGTGLVGGALREPAAGLLAALGALRARWGSRVCALDCPSGLDVDSGEHAPEALPADLTCTFAALKPALVRPVPLAGRVRVVPIGAPRLALERVRERGTDAADGPLSG
jgi:NAD(P)H-hydrate epimerase